MSIDSLLQHFQEKIEALKEAAMLRDVFRDDSCHELMVQLEPIVQHLEMTLSCLHKEVKVQRQVLARSQVLKENIRLFMEHVTYDNRHLPVHLPKPPNSHPTPSLNDVTQLPTGLSEMAKPKARAPKPAPTVPLLTIEEFSSVPKYMKGRTTYEQICTVIEEFNKALEAKHKIVTTPHKKQSVQIKQKIVEYKEQETKHTAGFFFVVDADITEHTRLKLDTVGRKCLVILRHCGRIKEQRAGRLIQYLVCPHNICY